MIIVKTSVPVNNSPNKDYTVYLYEMTPRLEPFWIINYYIVSGNNYSYSSDMVFYKLITIFHDQCEDSNP